MGRSISTKHSSIARYWSDKVILPNGKIYLRKDLPEGQSYIDAIEDQNVPCCMACGYSYKIPDAEDVGYDSEKVWALWDEVYGSRLERAHVVADSLGGNTSESNLVLLCPDCHKLLPDTIYVDQFFRYLYKIRTENHKFQHSFMQENELMEFNNRMDLKRADAISKGIPDNIVDTFLCPDKSDFNRISTTHGGMTDLKPNTFFAAVEGYFDECMALYLSDKNEYMERLKQKCDL